MHTLVSIDATILQKVFYQHVRDCVGNEANVVGVGRAGKMDVDLLNYVKIESCVPKNVKSVKLLKVKNIKSKKV